MKESEFLLLLSKRFSGEITSAETIILDEWLRQSKENEQFAIQTKQIWEKAEAYQKTFTPNLDADFEKIRARIQPAVVPVLRATLGQKFTRIAAVAAVLFAAVWGWQQFSARVTEVVIAAVNDQPESVKLSDGSYIWLRKGSQLTYAKELTGAERHVKLQGEGYFEVKHDATHPFKVELENGGSVEVLGTQFGIRQTANQTSVLVRSGKVRFSPTAQTPGPVLTANQKAVFDYAAAQVRIAELSSLNELSWQTGGLEFVNTPLIQVVNDLELFYGVKITLLNAAMNQCPHSAPLTSQPIEKVLETLALTHQLRVKKLGEHSFELSGGQCR